MDFRVIFIEIFYIYLVLVFVFVFVEFTLVFGFWYLFYFVKFECRGMLASRLWKSLLFVTHSTNCKLFRGCFASVLSSLNIILIHFLLTSTTGVCYKVHCSSVSRFVENSYLTFNAIQLTSCHEKRDLGVRNLGTNYKRIYIFSFFV